MAPPEDNFATASTAPVELRFPAGTVLKTRATKAELLDSANAWLAMMQTQLGSVRYWSECGDRTAETIKSLDVLESHLRHMRNALRESENAR